MPHDHDPYYDDPDDGYDEYPEVEENIPVIFRNARRDHRGRAPGRGGPPARRPRPGGFNRPAPRPRWPQSPMVVRDPGPRRPYRPVPGHGPAPDTMMQGEYLSIKKSTLAELVPAAGQLWASFLARPEMPQASGNDIIDRDNASMHREALAMHQQNQTRILALTDLAARVAKLIL